MLKIICLSTQCTVGNAVLCKADFHSFLEVKHLQITSRPSDLMQIFATTLEMSMESFIADAMTGPGGSRHYYFSRAFA
jgi:hypothetical protein